MDPSNPGCKECIRGTIHAGEPVGKEETIFGLNTYITGNRSNPRGVIVLYSDIFGLALPNNKLLADAYAKSGDWLVYLPDFFKGDPVPLATADVLIPVDASKQSTFCKYTGILARAPNFIMWMTRHTEAPTSETFLTYMESVRRGTPRHQKIGIVGTCWGGKWALRAAWESNMIDIDGVNTPLVDAVVALHPSNLAFPIDLQNLVVPVSIGWGLQDENTKIEQKTKTEDVHSQEREMSRKLPEVEHKVYEPGRHGFAIRGNPDDPAERKCLEDSLTQVLQWFDRWL